MLHCPMPLRPAAANQLAINLHCVKLAIAAFMYLESEEEAHRLAEKANELRLVHRRRREKASRSREQRRRRAARWRNIIVAGMMNYP